MISACMIVRDEEKLLARCLESFAPAFDELCVVDTGSVDRTRDIARRFGAKVQDFTACNGPDGRIRDFAIARNASIEMASGDQILWMDADDVLRPGSAERLRRRAGENRCPGLRTTVVMPAEQSVQIRLFRNQPQHRFRSPIHEYPEVAGEIAIDREIVIDTFPDKTGKETSNDRNLRLCEEEVRANPQNRRMLFYLGNELRFASRFDEAIARFQRCLEVGGNPHCERYMAAYYIAWCHFEKGDYARAIEAGARAFEVDGRYAEAHCLIGDAHGRLGQHQLALRWYQSALACQKPPDDALLAVDVRKYGEHPAGWLAITQRRLAGTFEQPTYGRCPGVALSIDGNVATLDGPTKTTTIECEPPHLGVLRYIAEQGDRPFSARDLAERGCAAEKVSEVISALLELGFYFLW
jgi:glycosyltransferase involved in cell wall biosynthesis